MSRLENSARRNASNSEIELLQYFIQALEYKAGYQNTVVTSFLRTPYDQARIMYENYSRTGAQEQLDIYGPNGDRVIESFISNRNLPSQQIINRAATLIEDMAKNGQYVSNHLTIRQRDQGLLVFDIGLGSVENLEQLKQQAIAAGATKVLIENGALHIEIPKQRALQFINNFMQEMSPVLLNIKNNNGNNRSSLNDQKTVAGTTPNSGQNQQSGAAILNQQRFSV
jgi:hypothetical protein